jgi:hypothetical protein
MSDPNEINDIRSEGDFRGITFSSYKKTDVRKELINSLSSSKIEPACYWSAELVCSAHYLELWDIIITFASKYIHLANPKLPLYIEMRYESFKSIISNGYVGNELRLRNHPKMRSLFAEIVCVLCNSKRQHKYESVKIKKKEEYDIATMSQRLKAPRVDYAQEFFRERDPKEIFIAMNEFAYHISRDSKNTLLACYWVEWIVEFETICKAKKETCRCERRSHIPVDDKLQFDPIWMIWDMIIARSNQDDEYSPLTQKIVNSLLRIYCVRFTPGVRKKRRYLIYFAISLITTEYDSRIEMINDRLVIETAVDNINAIYKQIKQHEISPDTDYLFSASGYKGDKNGDLERTIKRLEALNAMNTIVRKTEDGNGSGTAGGEHNLSQPPSQPPTQPPTRKYNPYE